MYSKKEMGFAKSSHVRYTNNMVFVLSYMYGFIFKKRKFWINATTMTFRDQTQLGVVSSCKLDIKSEIGKILKIETQVLYKQYDISGNNITFSAKFV